MNLHIEHDSRRVEYDRGKEKWERGVRGEQEKMMKRKQDHPMRESIFNKTTEFNKSKEGLFWGRGGLKTLDSGKTGTCMKIWWKSLLSMLPNIKFGQQGFRCSSVTELLFSMHGTLSSVSKARK